MLFDDFLLIFFVVQNIFKKLAPVKKTNLELIHEKH